MLNINKAKCLTMRLLEFFDLGKRLNNLQLVQSRRNLDQLKKNLKNSDKSNSKYVNFLSREIADRCKEIAEVEQVWFKKIINDECNKFIGEKNITIENYQRTENEIRFIATVCCYEKFFILPVDLLDGRIENIDDIELTVKNWLAELTKSCF